MYKTKYLLMASLKIKKHHKHVNLIRQRPPCLLTSPTHKNIRQRPHKHIQAPQASKITTLTSILQNAINHYVALHNLPCSFYLPLIQHSLILLVFTQSNACVPPATRKQSQSYHIFFSKSEQKDK